MMNIYEQLWIEKKLELAEKIYKAPNMSVVEKEARELVEMIIQEKRAKATHLTIKPDKWEKAKEELQKGCCKGSVKIEAPQDTRLEEMKAVVEDVAEFLNKHNEPDTLVLITEAQALVMKNELFCVLTARD